MLGERRALNHWPRIRRKRNGTLVCRARVPTAGRQVITVRLLKVAVLLLALIGLLSATHGAWYAQVPEDTIWFRLSHELLAVRYGLRSLAIRFPEIADMVAYRSDRRIDWHLLGASLALYCGRDPFPKLLGSLFTPKARIVIVVSATKLRVRVGWFRRSVYRRDDPARQVTVRAVHPDAWSAGKMSQLLSESKSQGEHAQPGGIIEVITGLQRHRVLFAGRADHAEAIASRCSEMLHESDRLI